MEAEINILRRRVNSLEEEVSRIKRDNLHFVNELNKARSVSKVCVTFKCVIRCLTLKFWFCQCGSFGMNWKIIGNRKSKSKIVFFVFFQDLDQETLNRIDFQNQVQTLLEEIDFVRRVHDQEIGDLQAMAARDTTPENREYFKNELSSAIRDIRAEYDQV